MDVVADISATNHVSQALTRGQRESRLRAQQQRPSACAKLAIPLPTLPSLPDSPPVDSLTDLGKSTLEVDTGGPVLPALDLGHSRSVPSSAAFEKESTGQGTGSEDSSGREKSEAEKLGAVKKQGGGHGQRDATARRGSWTRPGGPLLGPKGGVNGVDSDGCLFSSPAADSDRAHRRRSRQAAVVSDGVESGAQAQGHGGEVVRGVARDVVSRSASDNKVGIGARLDPTDPLCMEERGLPSALEPIAHQRKNEASGHTPSAGVASFLPRDIGESGAAVTSGTGGPAGILSRG